MFRAVSHAAGKFVDMFANYQLPAAGSVDLNYRINLPDADVRDILSSGSSEKLEALLKYDQVRVTLWCCAVS
jgi:hypothetical protein